VESKLSKVLHLVSNYPLTPAFIFGSQRRGGYETGSLRREFGTDPAIVSWQVGHAVILVARWGLAESDALFHVECRC